MIVYNAASKPIVLRAFAANVITSADHPVMIDVGASETLRGPILRKFGFAGPYIMPGTALVRDWGELQIVPADDVPEITLRDNQRQMYKRPCPIHPKSFEGFFVAYFDQYHLIDSL